jgi:hypothetical protein
MKENDNPDEIGSPDTLCTELTKLQIEYKKRVALEKSEINDIMQRYQMEILGNMNSSHSTAKILHVYEECMSTKITQWLKDVNGRFSYYDENNMLSSDPNRKMTGEQWRNALHAGICLKANPLRSFSNTG